MTMTVLNWILCAVLAAAIIGEVILIVKRNRQVRHVGTDDFLLVMLVMAAVLFLFPFAEAVDLIEAARNLLGLVFLFGTFAIRRGLSDRGLVKVFFTVPWNKIQQARVDPVGMNKARVRFSVGRIRWALQFPVFRLDTALDFITQHDIAIEVEPALMARLTNCRTDRPTRPPS